MAIVGGGINGCALARAAARRGIRTALLEKRDFGCGVTSRSTRLIHGGLRYLESFQVGLVRESLKDRESLLREFPGQVIPQPFILPVYRSDSRSRWYLAAGLAMYRALSFGSRLPAHRRLNAAETLRLLPGLDSSGLVGGFEYYDCQAAYPERLALEMALQARAAGACLRNHARVTGFLRSSKGVEGVEVEGLRGREALRSRVVVNACGAWADELLDLLPESRGRRLLSLVNGAHLVLRDFPGSPRHAVYHEARSDGRPFFIVPWRGLYLVGTTETLYTGSPDRMLPTPGEVDYLLEETNALFPDARLGRGSVLYSYCGSRPLLRSEGPNLNRASRGHAVIDHARRDGIRGLLTLAGGKLTTAPSFAEQAADRIEREFGRRLARPSGRQPSVRPPGVRGRLAVLYGPRAEEVRRFVASAPELAEPLASDCAVTRGEVVYAVRKEMALTLGDILLRRTGAAFDPAYRSAWARRAAKVAAPWLDWDDSGRRAALAGFEAELRRTIVREGAGRVPAASSTMA